MLTDPVADMLTRIRNAIMARHERVRIPSSTLKQNIAGVLRDEGYVSQVDEETNEQTHSKMLTVTLKYSDDRSSVIEGLRRVSRPGRRVFVRAQEIPKVRAGLGIAVLSTSRGVLSDRQARKAGVGGELLCEVW